MAGNDQQSNDSGSNEEGAGGKREERGLVIPPQVRKEFEALPEKVRDRFLLDLALVCAGQEPLSKKEHLGAVGPGVIELKINRQGAYRCVYYVKTPGKVHVLLATVKSASYGRDKRLIETATARLKSLG